MTFIEVLLTNTNGLIYSVVTIIYQHLGLWQGIDKNYLLGFLILLNIDSWYLLVQLVVSY